MKKIFILGLICFSSIMSFAQESRYVKVTDTITDFMQYDYDFIIAKKLNGKNIIIMDCELNNITDEFGYFKTKMENDTTVICNDSLSFCIFGACLMRNKDMKCLKFSEKKFVDEIAGGIKYSSFNGNFLIYNNSSRYIRFYNDYCKFKMIDSPCSISDKSYNLHTLEIYKRVDSMTSSVHEINSNLSDIKNSKIIKNGKIVIIKGDKEYDILGNLIQ